MAVSLSLSRVRQNASENQSGPMTATTGLFIRMRLKDRAERKRERERPMCEVADGMKEPSTTCMWMHSPLAP